MEQLTQFKLMKKMQSVYFFSILLFSSSLVLLILYSLKSLSIISILSVMKFNIDRNHVFLICNGILVFIVKSSSSYQDSNSFDCSSNAVRNDQVLPRPISASDQKKTEEFSVLSSEQKMTNSKVEHFLECLVHLHGDDDVNDDDDDEGNDGDNHEEDDDHHEYEEGAEELNKRCEEFIRRMKQGIISECKKDMMGLTTRFS